MKYWQAMQGICCILGYLNSWTWTAFVVDPIRHSSVCLVGRNEIWPNLWEWIVIEYNAFLITACAFSVQHSLLLFHPFYSNLYVLVWLKIQRGKNMNKTVKLVPPPDSLLIYSCKQLPWVDDVNDSKVKYYSVNRDLWGQREGNWSRRVLVRTFIQVFWIC